MRRILSFVFAVIFCTVAQSASAQWIPITNLTGTTVAYGGTSVTVTSNNGITGGGCGGLYWVQATNASYTFTFSQPVEGVWITVDAINTNEMIEFIINGSFFPITNCNLDPTPFVNNCSVNNCNIVNGQFLNNTTGWVCGGVMTFYGPITTFTINQPVGGSGTTFNISFAPPGSGIGSPDSVSASSNSPLCEGDALNLFATNMSNGVYSWTGPNGFTSNLQNPTINSTTLNMSGDYIVIGSGACGSDTDTVNVVINPLPLAPVVASNSPICENGTVNLTASTVPGATYNWTGPLFVSTLQNPTIPNVTLGSEGNYNATVTVAGCTSLPATTFVDIIPLPAAPGVSDIDYCQFTPSAPLTATGTALLWYTSQTGTGSPTAPVPNTSVAGTTTYWVTQTVNGCEGPMAAIVVTIKPEPLPPVYTGPVHFCRDDPASPLTASGQNIQWYDENHNLLPQPPTPVTSVPGDFTWYVTQTVNGCESPETTVIVHVADIPPAPGVADLTYCQYDETIALTAVGQNLKWYNNMIGGAPLIYAPVPSTDQPMVRTWYVSQTVDGCESPRAAITVTVHFLPTSTFAASRPLVCENDTLMFYYTGNGTLSEVYTWTWTNDSVILVDGMTDTQGPLTIRFDETGTYPITLNVDNQGCNTTTIYEVRVVPIPDATIGLASDVCIHDSVIVGLGSYNQPFATYNWYFDGATNVFNQIDDGTYEVQWNDAGIHIVNVTVGNTACVRTFADTVLVHAQPDAGFTLANPASSICIGDSLRLAAVDNNGLYSYEWGPAEFFNQSNNYAPVVNAYIRAAEYVTLTVATPWGCEATETVYMDAQPCCNVAMPNAFTPNGDGRNDIFRPIGPGNHPIKQFTIMNRWGKKVYESLDIKAGWDGTFNGEDQDIGTYYYILQYKCEGKTMDLKGEVILIR